MLERPDSLNDTIVACATAPGEGAIAIVRLSGPGAREVGRKLNRRRREARSHQLLRTRLAGGSGETLDEAMLVEMHAPHSYTGDDVVELHLHGSRAVVQAVIEACIGFGARLARPGEFTLRAFLNGRMDLTQAEAVADLIAARSEEQRRIAANHLEGELSKSIHALSGQLEGVLAEWRAALDFPEQLPDEDVREAQLETIRIVDCKIQSIIENARAQVKNGLKIVLCGAPNVGKSTLLNYWVGETRVLVDSTPGTTRDPVEVELFDGPIRWSVWDTAGIRSGALGLEARGIALSVDRIRKADVAVWLVSPENPTWPEGELEVLPMVVVGAKADLASEQTRKKIESEANGRGLVFLGWVSVRTDEGVKQARERLGQRLSTPLAEGVPVVVRQRHIEVLQHASDSLKKVGLLKREREAMDLLALELEEACRWLGRMLGRDVDQAIIDRIFSEFCLGK